MVFFVAWWRRHRVTQTEPQTLRRLPAKLAIPGLTIILLLTVLPYGRACVTRLASGTVTPDAAILNRFKVWQGAWQLLASQPDGVGTGHSGFVYMIAFPPDSAMTGYRTMVNSFLTLAVEQGLIVGLILIAVIVLALIFGLACIYKAENQRFPWLISGLTAALVAGLVAGWSSTCFDISVLPEAGQILIVHYKRRCCCFFPGWWSAYGGPVGEVRV